jgi:hypothetical protein
VPRLGRDALALLVLVLVVEVGLGLVVGMVLEGFLALSSPEGCNATRLGL